MESKFANQVLRFRKLLGRRCERSLQEKLGHIQIWQQKLVHQQRFVLLEVHVQIMQSCLLFPATALLKLGER
jgi:hypothetical protein